MVCFQSRFGPAEWLKPYPIDTMGELPSGRQEGAGDRARVHGRLPGDARGDRGREPGAFMHHGGEQFAYVPCLNDSR